MVNGHARSLERGKFLAPLGDVMTLDCASPQVTGCNSRTQCRRHSVLVDLHLELME
jgi:hypothetical protein